MRSVADGLRAETRAKSAPLTASERIALALRLGDEDARTLAGARGISVAEARQIIKRSRVVGRRPSCASEDPVPGTADGTRR